jgi:hypothetical protein
MTAKTQGARRARENWWRFLAALAIGIALFAGTLAVAVAADETVPTITIIEVEAGTSVTVRTANFPANRTFDVLFGQMGTQGVDGTSAGSFDSGQGGELIVKATIPAAFKGDSRIAIRFESGGYYSYNWFYNKDYTGSETASTEQSIGTSDQDDDSDLLGSGFYIEVSPTDDGSTAQSVPAPAEEPAEATTADGATAEATEPLTPTISFLAVSQGVSVTIMTDNFPPSRTFTATMSRTVTLGIDGIEVGTLDSGAGGALTATFPIPAELAKENAIAIRLESPDGYFSYAWFYNQDYQR